MKEFAISRLGLIIIYFFCYYSMWKIIGFETTIIVGFASIIAEQTYLSDEYKNKRKKDGEL